jgi:hypothetical protein
LGLDNLDALVMIYKNWLDDAWIDFKLAKKRIIEEKKLCKREII